MPLREINRFPVKSCRGESVPTATDAFTRHLPSGWRARTVQQATVDGRVRFIVGGKLKAGLFGEYPSLAPADLVNGDMKYNVDFRSVYAGILEGWLKTSSAPVLGRQFPPLICA